MSLPKEKRPGGSGGSQTGQAGTGQGTAWQHCITEASGIWLTNREFLAHAFHRCGPDEAPWVTGFPGDPGTVEPARWAGRSALPLPNFIRDDHNNYVVVSVFEVGPDGRIRRRKDHFAAMSVVMIDDVGTKVPFERLLLEPTCLVETSPGNFQAWYFLREPVRNRALAEALIRGLIASGLTADGTDPGMNGVTRYGRLPVGINGKAKYADAAGKPFVQRVAYWSPTTRYAIEDIAQAYGIDLTIPPPGGGSVRRTRRPPPARGSFHGGDGIVGILDGAGLYLESMGSLPGGHRIVCPWVHEHTDEDPTGTAYFEPSEDNAWAGGFKCHHGHCLHRTIADLTHFVSRLQTIQLENTHD